MTQIAVLKNIEAERIKSASFPNTILGRSLNSYFSTVSVTRSLVVNAVQNISAVEITPKIKATLNHFASSVKGH